MKTAAHTLAKLPLLGALAALLACGPDPLETPEIAPARAAGAEGTELVFRIARHERHPDGRQSLSAVGLLRGRSVGFDLELGPWRENPPGYVNLTTWDCSARLRSQGAPSDELLQFLDTLYATHLSPARMLESIEVQALSPWKNPGQFSDGAARFLLLFPIGLGDGDEAEVWIRIDPEDARIYLKEKEPRLRRSLVSALSASP